jgi:hypothetical protein
MWSSLRAESAIAFAAAHDREVDHSTRISTALARSGSSDCVVTARFRGEQSALAKVISLAELHERRLLSDGIVRPGDAHLEHTHTHNAHGR